MTQTLLAIDEVSLPLRKDVCLYLGRPTVRPEPVLAPSPADSNAPDNLAAHFYGTVLHDAGRFRMWYYACHRGMNPDWPPRKRQQVARQPGWLIGVKEGYEVVQGPLCEPGATPGQAFLHRDDSPATPAPGHAFNTIHCQGNGILNVGDETRIYHGRWRNAGQKAEDIAEYYRAEVALATWPRDRWGALGLNPGAASGAICSGPLSLCPGKLRLNADGAPGMTVDLLSEQFEPLPGCQNGEVPGDGLDAPVRWPQPPRALGEPTRVRVNLRRAAGPEPRLYAVYATEGAT
jgi:hypothetical protein